MNPVVANAVTALLFGALPMASVIVAFLVYRELRAIRKLHQAKLGYDYIVALMRWRKKFYSLRTSKTERLVAKAVIIKLQSCLNVKDCELPRL